MGFKHYIYIYSGKPKTVYWYWLVSEIYHTTGQTGTASGTILTPLILRLTKRERERKREREVARDEMQSILKLGQKSLIPMVF